MIGKIVIAHHDQLDNRRASRTDYGSLDLVFGNDFTADFGDQFGAARYFEHVVKSDLQQPVEDGIDVGQIVELPVQRRRGHRHAVFEPLDHFKRIVRR